MKVRHWLISVFAIGAALTIPTVVFASGIPYQQQQVHLPLTMTVPTCTGSEVKLSGYENFSIHEVSTNAGTQGQYTLTENMADVKGIDLNNGATYVAAESLTEHRTIASSDSGEFTLRQTFNLVSQGSGQDIMDSVLIHITVNAIGNVTANVLNASSTCP